MDSFEVNSWIAKPQIILPSFVLDFLHEHWVSLLGEKIVRRIIIIKL